MDAKKIMEVRSFWNKQANLGFGAGSRDLIAKQLEIEAISSYISDSFDILDFGCGNGITAMELARRFKCQILGMDFAEEMIQSAKKISREMVFKGSVDFQVGEIQSLKSHNRQYDIIYTERMVINLPDWESQKEAILLLLSLLKPGGMYLMCENSQDGLDKINQFRKQINLPEIIPPWHNRYLKDEEINNFYPPDTSLEKIDFYSSTYYFLSRIINAKLAQIEGHEPDYDSQINQLALSLSPYGDIGQGRIWVWRKHQD
jgi:2-polyprenyl-3-methyl-5-hydroxy-6-metoxy-1,4-benzoquinol methylase